MAFVTRKFARTGEGVIEGRTFAPVAPGAVRSPQQGGLVPDLSTVPGHAVLPVPIPAEGARRPTSERGTSQAIMGVYRNAEFDVLKGDLFETMALPSYEEQRKADPTRRTPARPQDNYVLSASGIRLADQVAALAAEAESPADDATPAS